MTVDELAKKLGLEIVAGANGIEREIRDAYCGDLLSDVMGKAPEGCVWITVQGHPNVVAVAVLKEMAAVIISGGHNPDRETIEKSNEEAIPLLLWNGSSYQLAGTLYEIGIGRL